VRLVSFVPKTDGSLKLEVQIDTRNEVQKGMLIGKGGRQLKEINERCKELMIVEFQRPVKLVLTIVMRRHTLDQANSYRSFNKANSPMTDKKLQRFSEET